MIYIQVLDKYWEPGKDAGLTGIKALMYDKKIAKIFVEEIKRNIDTERLRHAPLSRRYLQSKAKKGYSLKKWEATSHLKDSLTVKRISITTYMVGWDRKLHYNGERIVTIAKRLEYGTMTMPPRPLFRDTLKQMKLSPIERRKKNLIKTIMDFVFRR